MTGTDRARDRLAAGAIAVLGVLAFLAQTYYLLTQDLSLVGSVFGVLVPMAFSVALVGAAVWLDRTALEGAVPRVAGWCLAGALALVVVAAALVVFQLAIDNPLADVWFVLVVQVSVGGVFGVVLGVYDTRGRLARLELVAERENASLLGRRLTVLNRVLRHDIRNAVSVIRGNAELILEGTTDPETVAETIRYHASEMARLSEQAREIEGTLSAETVQTERFDVATVVSAKALAVQNHHGYVTIHRAIDGAAWIDASPLVENAVENLLQNAVQHNDALDPTIWVAVTAESRDGEEVVAIRVEDDGPGIPKEQLAVLRRGRETAMEHTSGLGLWLVDWIVRASGGEVAFERREPRGSVVELCFSRVEPPA